MTLYNTKLAYQNNTIHLNNIILNYSSSTRPQHLIDSEKMLPFFKLFV